MKLKAITGLICALALLGLPTGAQAKAPIPTTMVSDGLQFSGPNLEFTGHLTSPNSKCLAGRTVKFFIDYNSGGWKQVDTDVTSANGVWAGSGVGSMQRSAKATVSKKTIGPRKHRRTCGSASVPIPL